MSILTFPGATVPATVALEHQRTAPVAALALPLSSVLSTFRGELSVLLRMP